MHAKLFALTLAAAMPWSLFAAPPDATAVVVTCRNADWPSPRQIAHYINAHSFEDMQAARRQMLRDGRRACRRGASQVQLVFLVERANARLQATMQVSGERSVVFGCNARAAATEHAISRAVIAPRFFRRGRQ